MRLVRERRQDAQRNEDGHTQWFQRRFGRPLLPIVGRGMRAEAIPRGARATAGSSTAVISDSAVAAAAPTSSQIEMANMAPNGTAAATTDAATTTHSNAADPAMTSATLATMTAPRPPAEDAEGRREWARRRASALLHRQSVMSPDGNINIEEEEQLRIAGLPRWRKALGTVFPAVRN